MPKRTTNHEPRLPANTLVAGITNHIYVVILVGGKGKRLRPLSTDARPKAFLSVTKDRKTMFRRTVERVENLVRPDNIVVVANRIHARLVRRDFPNIVKRNLLLEPASRNTAPAIALAASVLKKRSQDALMVVLPTDQYVLGVDKYLDSIKSGISFARNNNGVLVVLGVGPKEPSTEYGYIRVKGHSSASLPSLRSGLRGTSRDFAGLRGTRGSRIKNILKVTEFVEKPDLKTAKKYNKSGCYLWNAGGFIFHASALLKAIERFAPAIFNGLKNLNRLDTSYKKLPNISIDYAVMEKASNLYCIKGSYGWQDLGSFDNLKVILKRESRDFIMRDERIVKIL